MIRPLSILAALLLALSACAPPPPGPGRGAPVTAPMATDFGPKPGPTRAAQQFHQVLADVQPVAEQLCRERRPDLNCRFRIAIDDRPDAAPNAFQTLDPQSGQPIIGFTLSLIAEARNADELAFVLGHEAAHHLAGHIPRQRQSATAGALVLGTLAALGGADSSTLETVARLGATVGARSYSKDYELEADALGTLIAWRAGYHPERGAGFFARLPDPGNQFLGSHPPNEARMQTVARTMAAIRAGTLR